MNLLKFFPAILIIVAMLKKCYRFSVNQFKNPAGWILKNSYFKSQEKYEYPHFDSRHGFMYTHGLILMHANLHSFMVIKVFQSLKFECICGSNIPVRGTVCPKWTQPLTDYIFS